MKKMVLMLVVALIVGCSGMGVKQEPIHHQLEVTVTGGSVESIDNEQSEGEVLNGEAGGKLSHLSYISGDKLYIDMFSGLSVGDVRNIKNDILKAENNTEIRDLELFVNSPGGDAFAGLALADVIINAQKRGWKITALANGIVASAAVPTFAVCGYRVATQGTIFMVHEAALWKWPGRETSSDIRSQNELMVTLQNQYLSYLVDHTKLSLAEWIVKEKATTWFTAGQAKEWGMVDEIR